MLVYELMDPVMVIETTSAVWKTAILAVELHRVIKKREVEAMTEFHGFFTRGVLQSLPATWSPLTA